MQIAICDDQLETAEQLFIMVKHYFSSRDLPLNNIQLYQDGSTLLEDYEHAKRYGIIFLDIEMPSLSGMEVAKRIRQMDSEVLLVFVTGYPDYMAASFKVEAFDFLPKPVTVEEIDEVLARCVQKYEQKYKQIMIKTQIGITALCLNDIVYVTSDLHYVEFVLLDERSIRIKTKMNHIAEELQSYQQFVRCHQSYIVNLDYVQEVQRQQILLNKKIPNFSNWIPISRKYINSTKEKFLMYHLKRRSPSE